MDIIEAIYLSTIIPEEHKEQYVSYIEKNGITEKFLSELEKVFAEEQKSIEMDLQEKKELVAGLQQLVAEEKAKNDRPQAEILASVEEFMEGQEKKLKSDLDGIDKTFNMAFEQVGKSGETSEIEKIRAALAKPKKAA